MPNTSKVYNNDGNTQVVDNGGKIQILTGGQIVPNSGTQASAITDGTAITGGESPTEAEHNAVITKLNSVLAALRGVGIIAS